jgi:hypothetical protein
MDPFDSSRTGCGGELKKSLLFRGHRFNKMLHPILRNDTSDDFVLQGQERQILITSPGTASPVASKLDHWSMSPRLTPR